MRTFFLVCFVACTVAVAAPLASDTEVISSMSLGVTLTSATDPGPTARPTEVTVKLTRPAKPRPTQPPAAPLIFVPKHQVARATKTAAPAPTPKPTAVPTAPPTKAPAPETAKATAKPQPTAKPAPSPSGATYTRDQVIAGIRAGWSGNDDKAIDVADCESGLNPRASSPGGTYLGLWQFHIETWRNYGGTGDPRDHSPQVQTQVAWSLFQDHGWGAWPGCA